MYIGIDIGTSAIKAILTDRECQIVDKESVALTVSRPQPLWSEQLPEDWWQATLTALDAITKRHPKEMAAVRAIGLAGQMHGAVLLDSANTVLRPAILWNDGRCEEECKILEQTVPTLRAITGNIAMPGFTAPKLLWVKRHEPDIFAKVAKVLLPKDYIRFRFTDAFFGDMSDCAGTLWLDVQARAWSAPMLAACGLTESQMPTLREGSDRAGTLKPELAKRWGMGADVVFAGGAGDNAAGAIGIGAIGGNDAFISLGTSGVYFAATDAYAACPEKTVHAFCHALPNKWHQMGVILSAASCVKSAANFLGDTSDTALAALVDQSNYNPDNSVIFLPYLSGERTPHNNPAASGCFFGITHSTTRKDMVQAVLEGVAFAFADCQDALIAAGSNPSEVTLIGGGSRNKLWGEIIASVLNRKIVYVADGDQGPAYGGARLAALADSPERASEILVKPEVIGHVNPNAAWAKKLETRLRIYRDLYNKIEPLYK